ncbi:TetR/AcrR family transcriptional regulator [Kineococcus gynurae]|uniref:TetR/AcrR family transcriptional regulator n=1 Tax=Kineococcus gynurae TaxID=452979 RepID=UPI003D7D52DE
MARSRARLLDAATACFLARGYDGTTVEQVAETAGVSRRTAFNVYADKDSLFRAALGRSVATAQRFTGSLTERVHLVPGRGDLRTALEELALDLATTVLTGPVVPLRRLLAREGERFPDLLEDYRRGAPEAVLRALAGCLADLHGRGELDVPDPAVAAEHFAFLVMGADLDRGMLGRPPPPPARVRDRARSGAAAFCRAYVPRGGAPA